MSHPWKRSSVSFVLLLSPLVFADTQSEDNQEPEEREEEVVQVEGKAYFTEMDEDTERLMQVPGIGNDPLAALDALPGVSLQSFGEGPAVRGSAPEDNQYLVNGMPVGYLFHFMGYSIFDEESIRSFDLKTGAFEADKGQSVGAILDVELREPRNQELGGAINLSFLNAGGIIEGAITENQSFYASYRKSTLTFFGPIITGNQEEDPENGLIVDKFPDSQDYYGVYHWDINDNNALDIRAIGARDELGFEITDKADAVNDDPALEGNLGLLLHFDSLAADWTSRLGSNGTLKTTASYLTLTADQTVGSDNTVEVTTEDVNLKSEYSLFASDSHLLVFGAEQRYSNGYYDIDLLYQPCSRFDPDCSLSGGIRTQAKGNEQARFDAIYVKDEWAINNAATLISGLRASVDDFTEESHLEPRLKLEYRNSYDTLFTAAYGKHHKFPEWGDLIEDLGNPDLKNIKSTHYVLGVEQETFTGWTFSAETYYKEMDDLVISVDDGRNYTNDASGEAYGLELLIERASFNRLSGWLSIGMARSKRTDEINDVTSDFSLDKPLMINLVANYQLSERWSTGIKAQYESGDLITPITGGEPYDNPQFAGFYEPQYGEPFSERLPATYTVDYRIEYSNNRNYTFYLDVLNLVDVGAVTYDYNEDYSERKKVEDEGLGLLPILGFEWEF